MKAYEVYNVMKERFPYAQVVVKNVDAHVSCVVRFNYYVNPDPTFYPTDYTEPNYGKGPYLFEREFRLGKDQDSDSLTVLPNQFYKEYEQERNAIANNLRGDRMTARELHTKAMALVEEANIARRQYDYELAVSLLKNAHKFESDAASKSTGQLTKDILSDSASEITKNIAEIEGDEYHG